MADDCGVNTLPGCRRRGYAGLLLQRAIEMPAHRGRKGLVLTCKEEAFAHYAKFGFVNEGGLRFHPRRGVVWYQMRLGSEVALLLLGNAGASADSSGIAFPEGVRQTFLV